MSVERAIEHLEHAESIVMTLFQKLGGESNDSPNAVLVVVALLRDISKAMEALTLPPSPETKR